MEWSPGRVGEEVDGRYVAGSLDQTGCSLKVVIPNGRTLVPQEIFGSTWYPEMLLVITLVLGRDNQESRVLLNTLQCAGQDPTEKNYVVQRLIAPSLRNPDLE